MTAKHSPATSLPWKHEEIRYVGGQNYMAWTVQAARDGCVAEIKYTGRHPKGEPSGDERNADYIVHAANAYPKLVERAKQIKLWANLTALEESGHGNLSETIAEMAALLRELGEAE